MSRTLNNINDDGNATSISGYNVAVPPVSNGDVLQWQSSGQEWHAVPISAPGGIDTVANVGGGSGVFRNEATNTAYLRSITQGNSITVTQNSDDINIKLNDVVKCLNIENKTNSINPVIFNGPLKAPTIVDNSGSSGAVYEYLTSGPTGGVLTYGQPFNNSTPSAIQTYTSSKIETLLNDNATNSTNYTDAKISNISNAQGVAFFGMNLPFVPLIQFATITAGTAGGFSFLLVIDQHNSLPSAQYYQIIGKPDATGGIWQILTPSYNDQNINNIYQIEININNLICLLRCRLLSFAVASTCTVHVKIINIANTPTTINTYTLSVSDSTPSIYYDKFKAAAIKNLYDVALSSLTSGQLLQYNGTNWQNVDPVNVSCSNLGNSDLISTDPNRNFSTHYPSGTLSIVSSGAGSLRLQYQKALNTGGYNNNVILHNNLYTNAIGEVFGTYPLSTSQIYSGVVLAGSGLTNLYDYTRIFSYYCNNLACNIILDITITDPFNTFAARYALNLVYNNGGFTDVYNLVYPIYSNNYSSLNTYALYSYMSSSAPDEVSIYLQKDKWDTINLSVGGIQVFIRSMGQTNTSFIPEITNFPDNIILTTSGILATGEYYESEKTKIITYTDLYDYSSPQSFPIFFIYNKEMLLNFNISVYMGLGVSQYKYFVHFVILPNTIIYTFPSPTDWPYGYAFSPLSQTLKMPNILLRSLGIVDDNNPIYGIMIEINADNSYKFFTNFSYSYI